MEELTTRTTTRRPLLASTMFHSQKAFCHLPLVQRTTDTTNVFTILQDPAVSHQPLLWKWNRRTTRSRSTTLSPRSTLSTTTIPTTFLATPATCFQRTWTTPKWPSATKPSRRSSTLASLSLPTTSRNGWRR